MLCYFLGNSQEDWISKFFRQWSRGFLSFCISCFLRLSDGGGDVIEWIEASMQVRVGWDRVLDVVVGGHGCSDVLLE